MAIPSLDDTQGALFIGTSIAGALFGVSCVQTYFYAMNYTHDPWHLKALVAFVFILDLFHQLCISHSIYVNVITNYANPAALFILPWSLIAEVEATAVIAALVQGFYVFRVWRLSHQNYYLTILVAVLIVPAFVIQTIYTAKMCGTDLIGLVALTPLAKAINAINACEDVLIAVVMVFLLRQGKTGSSASDGMINRLVLFVVNTGTLTSICAIAAFIALMCAPAALIYAIFFFTTPRLYVNSLLATLNARQSIRGGHVGSHGEVISLRLAQNGSIGPNRSQGPNSVSVNVEQTTTFDEPEKLKKGTDSSYAV